MSVRRITVAAIILATAAAVPAQAAKPKAKPVPKPLPKACNLVVDPPGDTYYQERSQAQLPMQALDVVKADMVSDGKTVTAVIKVTNLSAQDLGMTGTRWQFWWSSLGAQVGFWMQAQVYLGSTTYKYGYSIQPSAYTNYLGIAEGKIDMPTNEIRMSVAVAKFNEVKGGPSLKPLAKITNMQVYNSTPITGFFVDNGASTPNTMYTITQPSCISLAL